MAVVEPPGDHSIAMLRALFERVGVGVAFYDRDLRFISVNDAFAAMDGIPIEGHTGRALDEILPRLAPQIAPHLRAVFTERRASGDVALTGIRHRDAPRAGRWIASYHPVPAEGEPVAAMALVTDVTAQRRAEDILLTERDVLERCVLGEPLTVVLDRVTNAVAEHSVDSAIPSI